MNSGSVHPLGWLALLTIRGLLLWFLVPGSFVVWLLGAIWFVPRGATLGRFLGWIDINFILTIEETILRPFFPEPTHSGVRFADIATVKHRIGALDFF